MTICYIRDKCIRADDGAENQQENSILLTFAFVSYVCGTGVTIETLFAAVAEDAGGVVDTLEAFARLSVTVSHSVGVDVVIAATRPARPDGAFLTQRVPKEAIVTKFTTLTWVQEKKQDGI